LLETIAAQLLLHGNAFVQVLQAGRGRRRSCSRCGPERVSVEADASGWPAAYLYKVGEARMRVPARDGAGRPGWVHLRALHPLDDHYWAGMPGRGGGRGGDIHNAGRRLVRPPIGSLRAQGRGGAFGRSV
jgi:phage portal protein BeeE